LVALKAGQMEALWVALSDGQKAESWELEVFWPRIKFRQLPFFCLYTLIDIRGTCSVEHGPWPVGRWSLRSQQQAASQPSPIGHQAITTRP
jgi:hypothetical protein